MKYEDLNYYRGEIMKYEDLLFNVDIEIAMELERMREEMISFGIKPEVADAMVIYNHINRKDEDD